jgi:hypothetical protein
MTAPTVQFIDQTPREFLASLNPPKAVAGARGRFSKDAQEALATARGDGFLFIGDAGHPKTEVKAPRAPKAPAAPKTVVTGAPTTAPTGGTVDAKAVRAWAKANGVEVGERGRIKPEVITRYLAGGGKTNASASTVKVTMGGSKPKPEAVKVRDEKTGYSVIGGILIRQDACGNCNARIPYCGCKKGPQVHKFLAREVGTPVALILDKA